MRGLMACGAMTPRRLQLVSHIHGPPTASNLMAEQPASMFGQRGSPDVGRMAQGPNAKLTQEIVT